MAKVEKEKKEQNNILIGILFILGGIFAIAKSNEYVWMLFHVIEVPLWVLGGLAVLFGIVALIKGIKEKKAKKEQEQQVQ